MPPLSGVTAEAGVGVGRRGHQLRTRGSGRDDEEAADVRAERRQAGGEGGGRVGVVEHPGRLDVDQPGLAATVSADPDAAQQRATGEVGVHDDHPPGAGLLTAGRLHEHVTGHRRLQRDAAAHHRGREPGARGDERTERRDQ